jgi:hypothetical protein
MAMTCESQGSGKRRHGDASLFRRIADPPVMIYSNFDNRMKRSFPLPEARQRFLRELEERTRRDRENRRAERVASRSPAAKRLAGAGID